MTVQAPPPLPDQEPDPGPDPGPAPIRGAPQHDRSAGAPSAQGRPERLPPTTPARAQGRTALLAYALLALTAALWAGNGVAGRVAVGQMSPMVLVALRWVIVVAILAVVARRDVVRGAGVLLAAWRYLLVWGALGFTIFNALFYAAAYHTTAVNLTLFQGATPALVLVGALLVFREPVRPLQAVGVALATVGVVLVAGRGSLAPILALDLNRGDAFMLLGSLVLAGYALALRRRPEVPDLALFAGFAAGAFLTSLPFVAWEIAAGQAYWPTPRGWLALAYVALGPSLIAQLGFLRGVALIGPARAGLFVNLVPVLGALLAVALLGESFEGYHAAALALVLGGIALSEAGRR